MPPSMAAGSPPTTSFTCGLQARAGTQLIPR
eukprot:CAMPEP_0171817338 /NCGR_PEP_ID=MMETSP0992-20121227/1035_1 /TAXON_ID=483369 /ORGANISM="non described non described, Strain CCMP2098" /LENGTH=30 /DNA_ID= /DNA_START= /DNA_END= /DNA_ORIENTATION=